MLDSPPPGYSPAQRSFSDEFGNRRHPDRGRPDIAGHASGSNDWGDGINHPLLPDDQTIIPPISAVLAGWVVSG